MSADSRWRARLQIALPTMLTLLLAAAGLVSLAGVVWVRQGNLAWDDAGYLLGGLRLARIARESGPIAAVEGFLHVQPKPPWLVGWIGLVASALGPAHLRAGMVLASVGPFALLAIAVVLIARRKAGPWAGLAALGLLLASPLAMLLGAKVMVESFMALWVLLALAASAAFLREPSCRIAAGIGACTGLAALTKMTVVLLLPVPLAVAAVIYLRRYPLDRRVPRFLLAMLAAGLVVAGPWYARNGRAAVEFARFSSRYNIEAEARPDRAPRWSRLWALARDVAGLPAAVVASAAVALWLVGRRRRRDDESSRQLAAAGDLAWLALIGTAAGAVILLRPPYFDPRFLLPIWPAVLVVLGGWMARHATLRGGLVVAVVIGLGIVQAGRRVAADPIHSTYWSARGLIDELVQRRDVDSIANVGNSPHWNVAKTGLINELRDRPDDCFVLLDLSRATPEMIARKLDRLDAVVVLGGDILTDAYRAAVPGLNRSYEATVAALRSHPRFEPYPVPAGLELPPLTVYVRRPTVAAVRPTPRGGRSARR